uniref:Uncharacterized protein n=1 Tax=viral metagenome TaxID=1070528 RepID=A0A6C0JJB3_9ZZZZ
MDLCKYKDSLGIPNEGAHKHYYGVAMFDTVGTIVVGIILSFLFKWNTILTIAVLFILGIILHRLFCVRTTVDKILFS